MRLGIVYFADVFHGYGHHYRCQTVAQVARKYGHQVKIISNSFGSDIYLANITELINLANISKEHNFDWLIIDLEEAIPDWLCASINRLGIKIANLNGIGWDVKEAPVDLVWVQDTPERVIIRDAVLQTERKHGNYWFVFGGSADPLNLCQRFITDLSDQSAFLIRTSLNIKIDTTNMPPTQRVVIAHDDTILPYMASAQYACIHCGMAMWELAYLGVPSYIFSRSPEHLHFAQNMENYAFARAYPEVGLPDKNTMREFLLNTPRFSVPIENRPDGKGAARFLAELEQLSA